MSPSGKLWTIGVVCALAGALLGGGAAVIVQQQQIATLQLQLAAAKTLALSAQQEAADAKQVQVAASAADGSAQTTTPTSAVATTPLAPKPAPKPIRQYSFVNKVAKSGSSYSVVADYAEFLTGKPAAAAATAHGDESPPPNDYYVVNDNPLLRTLPVLASASVKLYDKADGTSDPSGYKVSVAAWSALMAPSSTADTLKHAGYWLTLSGGKVIAAQEQWVP